MTRKQRSWLQLLVFAPSQMIVLLIGYTMIARNAFDLPIVPRMMTISGVLLIVLAGGGYAFVKVGTLKSSD